VLFRLIRFYGPPSVRCNFVPSASEYQPPGSDHLLRSMQAASGVNAAGAVEPAISADEVSMDLSLTQRSA